MTICPLSGCNRRTVLYNSDELCCSMHGFINQNAIGFVAPVAQSLLPAKTGANHGFSSVVVSHRPPFPSPLCGGGGSFFNDSNSINMDLPQ